MDENVYELTTGSTYDSDRIHDALANVHRRALLRYFSNGNKEAITSTDGTVTLTKLARELSHFEAADLGETSPAELRLTLHHCHLPKLQALDVLEYDADRKEIRFQDHPIYEAVTDVEVSG